MDKLNIGKPEAPQPTSPLYAHIRCSTAQFTEIERISRVCNLNRRKVCDALLEFALKRVNLIERPLYDLEIRDLGEDAELEP